MADYESVRQRIISSVFEKRNASGSFENYVSHVKIWEDTGEGSATKPRYILLSYSLDGSAFIHKSKLNTNGSFSVGKTWSLQELRGIEVISPLAFNITLARTYRWQTENHIDQSNFIHATVDLFRKVTNGTTPLHLVGLDALPANVSSSSSSLPQDVRLQGRSNGYAPTNGTPDGSILFARSQTPSGDRGSSVNGVASVLPRNFNNPPSRTASPASFNRIYSTSSTNFTPSISTADRSSTPSIAEPAMQPPQLQSARSTNSYNGVSVTNSQASTTSLPPSLLPSRNAIGLPPRAKRENGYAFINSRLSSETPPPPSPVRPAPVLPSTPPTPTSAVETSTPLPSQDAPRQVLAANETTQARRDPKNRISYFDPSNQAILDRLVTGDHDVDGEEEAEDEAFQATMASVEEMLEGYEWAGDDVFGRKTARGAADLVEARLMDELLALEKANIHSFLESDDRVGVVVKYLDDAVSELDNMASLLSSYKIHLNAVGDDISYIQSQHRGLQVQNQNQRALLNELENLLQTVHVDREALLTLTHESLEKTNGIARLEEAAKELYKALQAGRDTEMAATMERFDEYRTHNAQFCKRIFEYISLMTVAQAQMVLDSNNGIIKPTGRGRPAIMNHKNMEEYLGRYAGLILYLKEMDEQLYSKLCAAYFSAASDLHSKQMKALLMLYSSFVKKASEEDGDQNLLMISTANPSKSTSAIRRTGTIGRSPADNRKDKDQEKSIDELLPSEALSLILDQIGPQVYREDDFLADFLQINDAALTFADYTGLDNYFRRQATRTAGLSQATLKLVRGAMDLIFGFLPAELKAWLDAAAAKDKIQVVGVIACLEKYLADADERGNVFFLQTLEKQHTRLKGLFDRHMAQQVKAVEEIKLTSKKRKGIAIFIKNFPAYMTRIENQLIGADGLQIRATVDLAYEKLVQTMFSSLKQMATLDGDGEDKGQLNYHVILIENMHYFVAEISQLEIGSVVGFLKRAEAIYEENLRAYVKIVLRRPFGRIMDYSDGLERLLKTTAPTEVSKNANYNKSSLKKVVKEYNAKDVRRHVDTLFKRVEKHFTEAAETSTTEQKSGIAPGTVLVGVWKSCEEELLKMTELFGKRISQCYADSGVSLEYSATDVEDAFRRHQLGL